MRCHLNVSFYSAIIVSQLQVNGEFFPSVPDLPCFHYDRSNIEWFPLNVNLAPEFCHKLSVRELQKAQRAKNGVINGFTDSSSVFDKSRLITVHLG